MPTKPNQLALARPTLARLRLDAPTLPLVTHTLRVPEAVRAALMSQLRRWCVRHPAEAQQLRRTDLPEAFSPPTLAGKDLDGTIRQDHRHAYYLPTAEGD